MKHISLLLFSFFLLLNSLTHASVIDTLRFYDKASLGPNGINTYYGAPYDHKTYPKQYARFDPKAPGWIKAVIVTMGGGAGSVNMHFYGHEGGSPVPQLLKDLITPATITKTGGNNKKVTYTLPNPLWIDNNQFFLGFEGWSPSNSSISIGADNKDHVAGPRCVSSTGGEFFQIYLDDGTGKIGTDTYGFVIDVVMEYPVITSPNYLNDVTSAAGLPLNIPNLAVAWGDYNEDSFQDMLLMGKLYKNNGNGTFTDVSTAAGISGGASANNFVDMNNDGKLDIIFLYSSASQVFLNNGNGTFTVSPLTFTTKAFDLISSANYADINNDNYPDLFVGQLWNPYPVPEPNYLYLNNKALGFTDTTHTLYPAGTPDKQSRGSSFVDFDNDGDQDLYVANYYLQMDELWQNNGNGSFTNIIDAKGIDKDKAGFSGHGTGVDWADYDNDGDQDLLLSQLAHQDHVLAYGDWSTTLYQNTGAPSYNFNNLKDVCGIQYEETHAGCAWGDINSDGLMDVATTVFYGCRYVDIYHQKPDHTFELKSFDYGIQNLVTGEDLSWVDFDNDGKLDICLGDSGSFRLYRNTSPTGNFVQIDARSTTGNKFAIGTKVKVYAGGTMYTQEIKAGRGVRMQNPYRLFFGLGTTGAIDSVVITWPKGNKEKFSSLLVNNIYKITEGGTAVMGIKTNSTVDNSFSLSPNPFNDQVTFNYMLGSNENTSLEIFSLLGERVSVLQSGAQSGGQHTIVWKGVNDNGNSLPAGVYIYHFAGETFQKSGRVVISR